MNTDDVFWVNHLPGSFERHRWVGKRIRQETKITKTSSVTFVSFRSKLKRYCVRFKKLSLFQSQSQAAPISSFRFSRFSSATTTITQGLSKKLICPLHSRVP